MTPTPSNYSRTRDWRRMRRNGSRNSSTSADRIRSVPFALPLIFRFHDRIFGRFRGNVGHFRGYVGHFLGNVADVPGARRLIAQYPDAEVIVHALASPAGRGGVAVDANAEFGVRVFQFIAVVI